METDNRGQENNRKKKSKKPNLFETNKQEMPSKTTTTKIVVSYIDQE